MPDAAFLLGSRYFQELAPGATFNNASPPTVD
jgi:hypothetical protein